MRILKTILSTAVSLALCGVAAAQDVRIVLNIKPQPMRAALKDLGAQAGLQILFRAEDVAPQGANAAGVSGEVSVREALDRLLADTELTYEFVNERTVRIATLATSGTAVKKADVPAFRLAQAQSESTAQGRYRSGTGSSESGAQTGVAAEGSDLRIEEIIVTAQKRSERLQDVPVPVTAINAESLVASNQLRLEDYYSRIPGVSLAADAFRGSAGGLVIRGINADGGNPTVGIVIDDVSYGSSSYLGGDASVPDIDPSELVRVEVLRGPQGTLYGASSLGGLLKYVTREPSSEGFSGQMQGGFSSIKNGDDIGYNARGAGNVPLGDTFAVRASGFTRRDGGYIDDPGRGAEGVNRVDVDGGRLSALWRPSDAFSLNLGALLQDTERFGIGAVNLLPGLGDLEQSTLPNTGSYRRSTELYTATASVELGNVELISLSGYSINEFDAVIDETAVYGGATGFFLGAAGVVGLENNKTARFTQELRLSAPISDRVEWLVGLYYNDEDSEFVQDIRGADPATGVPSVAALFTSFPTTFREFAAFTNVTFKVTGRFDIQVGGRQSENKQTYRSVTTAAAALAPVFFPGRVLPIVNPAVETRDDSFTYLVTPRLRVTPDLMMYARFASGYRAGGPNFNSVLGVPAAFDPDTTKNYEIGFKGSAFDQALTFDASIYYIDWQDIQLSLFDPAAGSSYSTNGSHASSQGVELSLEAKPLTGLTLAAWVAWNDAELTEDLPAGSLVVGVDGDRLPKSSRFSGSVSVDQEFQVTSNITGIVRAAVSYVGDRKGAFPTVFAVPTPPRQEFPAYAKVDVHVGATYDTWTLDVFVNNATDRRGVLNGGLGTFNPSAFYYIQPRTIGMSLTKSF